MTDPIEINVTGRLMLMLTQLGIRDARVLSIFARAVSAVVHRRMAVAAHTGLADMDPILDEQLRLLKRALDRRSQAPAPSALQHDLPVAQAQTRTRTSIDGSAVAAEHVAARPAREPRVESGYVPVVKSQEEKLHDARMPVQALLHGDCVATGLLDAAKAAQLVAGMTGKTSQDAEREIVEYLRQVLQTQAKALIRKARGGPWADPRIQEDLRQDIHAAKSIRGILMLYRQVVKEYQAWEQGRDRSGLLGMFSARHRGRS